MLDLVYGRHRFTGSATLDNPLSVPLELLGAPLPGLDPSQLTAQILYSERCNGWLQSATVELQARPFVTGPVPWEVGTRLRLRIGEFSVGPDLTLNFNGSDLAGAAIFVRIANGASTQIPPECRPTPPPPTPTRRRDTPDGGRTPDVPRTPDRPPVRPQSRELPRFAVHFFYDATTLREELDLKTVDWVRTLMQMVPGLRVELRGHASMEGRDQYNLRLSRRRVEAVRDLLTLGAGNLAGRVDTLAMGEWAPEAPEPFSAQDRRSDLFPDSPLERARMLNRRVELILYDPTGQYRPTLPPRELTLRNLEGSLGSPGRRLSVGAR